MASVQTVANVRTGGTMAQIRAEALARAEGGRSFANYVPIFEGFTAKGIPLAEIEPRVNVLTYHAWQAKGRQVRKGEHGVRISTFVPFTPKGPTNPATGPEQGTAPEFVRGPPAAQASRTAHQYNGFPRVPDRSHSGV